jgi:hypothetical protein
MNASLSWLKGHTPVYDWNLKGEPQGVTADALLTISLNSAGPFSSPQQLQKELANQRPWFHLTDEEGRQYDSAEQIAAADGLWISQRQSPWSS